MDYAKTISWEPYIGRDLFKHYASKLSQIKTVVFCTCFTFCWTEYFELYLWICATLILQFTAGLDICNFNIDLCNVILVRNIVGSSLLNRRTFCTLINYYCTLIEIIDLLGD